MESRARLYARDVRCGQIEQRQARSLGVQSEAIARGSFQRPVEATCLRHSTYSYSVAVFTCERPLIFRPGSVLLHLAIPNTAAPGKRQMFAS